MQTKVSIITPVYNASNFIDNCIESILDQTYINWELILVDDGSQDDSLVKCRFYSAKDSRIKVFSKTNGGPSSARNIGIDNANGKYSIVRALSKASSSLNADRTIIFPPPAFDDVVR